MAVNAGAHIPAGPAWKEKPVRFAEPPLITNQDCLAHSQHLKVEMRHAVHSARQVAVTTPREVLEGPNSYWRHFTKGSKDDPSETIQRNPELKWSFDRVNDDTPYNQYDKRDTVHTEHSAAARRRCNVPLTTRRPIRTSQQYGWLPPVDYPKQGFGRSSVFLNSSMDKSHLGNASGPGSFSAR
mmetsp:Transcript_26111/g.56624  ORF Transcript_26111/g.56624 Transcript_26111/m.56624 type:complete len:183 (+) Transcript_26111:208-756(+)